MNKKKKIMLALAFIAGVFFTELRGIDSSDGYLRNDETIISSISVTDIVFDVYLGKWNYRAIPKVKTWSYFLTIP